MNFPNKLERKELDLTGLLILHNKLHMQKIISQGRYASLFMNLRTASTECQSQLQDGALKAITPLTSKAVEKFCKDNTLVILTFFYYCSYLK